MHASSPSASARAAPVAASGDGICRRRGERRMAHRVPCRVQAVEQPEGAAFSALGETVNFSPNGLAVQLGQPVEVGTLVEVLLPRLGAEPKRLRGRVAHSRRVVTGTFEIGISIAP